VNADGGDVSEAIGAVGWPSERQRAGQRWGPGAQPPRDDVLVIGYGNALRGDDAVGRRAAEHLAADGRLPGARIDAYHQLTPELAADIAAARLVVLVDARENDGRPGDVRLEQVVGCCRPPGSHTVDASALVDLATRLYGHAPPVILVSVTAERFDLGADLSPVVAAILPHVVDTVVAVVDNHLPATA
jgi:hydrogenase maturation protease